MATVKERFDKLGLAYSNPILQRCGEHIASLFAWRAGTNKKLQKEGERTFLVNSYSEFYTLRIDEEIIRWVNHQPGKYERRQIKNWWLHYKGLPGNRRALFNSSQ